MKIPAFGKYESYLTKAILHMNNLPKETIHKDDLHWRIQGLDIYVVGARKKRYTTYKIPITTLNSKPVQWCPKKLSLKTGKLK